MLSYSSLLLCLLVASCVYLGDLLDFMLSQVVSYLLWAVHIFSCSVSIVWVFIAWWDRVSGWALFFLVLFGFDLQILIFALLCRVHFFEAALGLVIRWCFSHTKAFVFFALFLADWVFLFEGIRILVLIIGIGVLQIDHIQKEVVCLRFFLICFRLWFQLIKLLLVSKFSHLRFAIWIMYEIYLRMLFVKLLCQTHLRFKSSELVGLPWPLASLVTGLTRKYAIAAAQASWFIVIWRFITKRRLALRFLAKVEIIWDV